MRCASDPTAGCAEATRRVLEATGVEFGWDRREAGIDEFEQHGDPLPVRAGRD
jgi:isocitrate dehydrogenase (NAD+)